MSEQLCGGLGRTTARLARVTERALGELGLSLPQYRVLSLLDEGAAAATALADHLAIGRPHVTALVDALVERAWVERRTDPEDRRRVSHGLTEAGRSALAAADDAVEARLASILGQLTPADGRRAATGLALWGDALDTARSARVATR